ncbi:phosphate acyltransferase, partial [Acinetobacter baumannii]
ELATLLEGILLAAGKPLSLERLAELFDEAERPEPGPFRDALAILREIAPDLEVDGEMHGDTALDSKLLNAVIPDSPLKGDANLLVMPNID